MQITHEGLREAYFGYYEDDSEYLRRYLAEVVEPGAGDEVESYESWLEGELATRCRNDSPLRRLEVYCEWNGILGYAQTLYRIATTEVVS